MSAIYRYVFLQYYWHASSFYVFHFPSCNNIQLQCLKYRHNDSQQEHIIAGINITYKIFMILLNILILAIAFLLSSGGCYFINAIEQLCFIEYPYTLRLNGTSHP